MYQTQDIYTTILPSLKNFRSSPTKMINPYILRTYHRPHSNPFRHSLSPYHTPSMPPHPLALLYLCFLEPSPHHLSLFYLTHRSLLHQGPFPGPPSIYSRPRIGPQLRRRRCGSVIFKNDRINLVVAPASVAAAIAASGWGPLPGDNGFVEGGARNEGFPFILRRLEYRSAYVRDCWEGGRGIKEDA